MITAGRLKALQVEDDPTPQEGLTMYAAHKRNRSLGPAGKWSLDDLRRRLAPSLAAGGVFSYPQVTCYDS